MALGMVFGLLYLPYAHLKYSQRLELRLLIVCVAAAGFIVWSVLPRIDRFQAPGPRLQPEAQPSLFREIVVIAGAVGQPLPAEVYLLPEVNAGMANRGGLMGFGSRRVMGLGLPLMQVLTVTEFRAVLAHEFGHFHGDITPLYPWVYKTRAAFCRTLANLPQSFLQKPFVWCARLFVHLTSEVVRGQEYAADALAAEVVGPQALISGLTSTFRADQAYEAYCYTEVAPVMEAGFRPPLTEGFRLYLNTPELSGIIQENLTEELARCQANPANPHPPLRDRLAALAGLPARENPPHDPPALSLLKDVPSLEKELFKVLLGAERAQEFQEISWEDILTRVYLPTWEETVRNHSQVLSDLRLGDLPDVAADLEEFVARFDFPSGVSLEEKKASLSYIIGEAVAAALHRQGCHLACKVGEPHRLVLAGEWLEPFSLMADLASEKLPAKQWQDLCTRAGVEHLPLGALVGEGQAAPGSQ